MSNTQILSLKEISLQNKIFEELNENLINLLGLNSDTINIPLELAELIDRSGILLYQALRINNPNVIVVYNLLTKFKSNIGDFNSLLLLKDLFKKNQINNIYKNCYEIIIKNIEINFINGVNYSKINPGIHFDINEKISGKIVNLTDVGYNYLIYGDRFFILRYVMFVYNPQVNDIFKLFKLFENQEINIDNILILNLFGIPSITDKLWELIMVHSNTKDLLLEIFIVNLIQSNNIILIEKYLIKIYDYILSTGNSIDRFEVSSRGFLYVIFDISMLYMYNLYNIQLFRIISQINQSKKIKCRIILKNAYFGPDLNEDEHVITSIFSIYKYFYPKQRNNIDEFVKKINKEYDLKLTSTNFY